MAAADASWRSTNAGARLFAANARAVKIKLAVVAAAGFAITEAQLALFHALDDAARPTDLAARTNLAKATVVELIDRAVTAGLVERRRDSADRRGQIVVPTAAGEALRVAMNNGIEVADRDAIAVIGSAAAVTVRTALARYVAAPGAVRPLIPGDADTAWAAANIGRATGLAARRFIGDVAAAVAREGFDATPAVLGMLRHLDLEGTRLTTLAASARTTKAAMTELVDRTARRGFVARVPDPADRRARRIVFTLRGFDLLAAVRRGIVGAEAALADVAGADLASLLAGLVRLAEAPPVDRQADAVRLSDHGFCHRSAIVLAA